MKKATLLFIFVFPASLMACPNYIGTWKSSRELTMDFNNKYSSSEPKVRELIPQITGTMTVEYTADQFTITDVPARKIIINGLENEWIGSNEVVGYELLGCTESAVAIKYSIYGIEFISQLFFQDENTYWEYMGNTNPVINAHAREYFVREETPNKLNQSGTH